LRCKGYIAQGSVALVGAKVLNFLEAAFSTEKYFQSSA